MKTLKELQEEAKKLKISLTYNKEIELNEGNAEDLIKEIKSECAKHDIPLSAARVDIEEKGSYGDSWKVMMLSFEMNKDEKMLEKDINEELNRLDKYNQYELYEYKRLHAKFGGK